jgi:F-type H+-transporting ATPase subunit a
MEISLAAEPIVHIGGFAITNTLLMAWVVILGVFLYVLIVNRRLELIPKGAQNLLEFMLEKFMGLVDSISGDRKKTEEFFPVVVTIFVFVLFSNWIEIVPGLGTIGIWENIKDEVILVPFIRSTSADLNFTLALALISVGSAQYFGVKHLGLWKYLGKFFQFKGLFKKKWGIFLPSFNGMINFFVGILELISEFAKIISFSFRLFGNIFAGEVLLLVVASLVPYIVPLPFLFLEIFVGFIQALVFSMLTLVFLKMATTH